MVFFTYLAFSVLFFIISRVVLKNYTLYKKISSMDGFFPNPSYMIGHVWYVVVIAYKKKMVGFEAGKTLIEIWRAKQFSDAGYLATWGGNLLLGRPIIVPTRVEMVQAILSSKNHVDKSIGYVALKPIFGAGLITSERNIWSRRRKLLNPTFHQTVLKIYVPTMNRQSAKLVQDIRKELESKGRIENTTHIISRRVMAMLVETIIGCDEDDVDPRFRETAEKSDETMCDRMTKPWKLIPFLYDLTEQGKEFNANAKFCRSEGAKLIKKRSSMIKSDNNLDLNANESKVRPALIDALISDHQSNPKETTIEHIVDEVFTFMIAGWDSTTWTVSFTLLLLGLHPEVQEKLYEEIALVMSEGEGRLTLNETMKMKYLECVINETSRIFPIVTAFSRNVDCDTEVKIDGKFVTIPKGTQFIIDSELLHHNPRYWKSPERFIPERFLPENSAGRDPYAFIPFSAGPRNCIGKAFAMMELKIVLSYILSSFIVKSLDPLDKISLNVQGIARRSHTPLRFDFYPRPKGVNVESP